ncbi:MAG: flagellar motor protein MotA [Nitrospirae bacterium RIFCSPLOW2_12_42_9]|nr:MAG: flagellar motor protein MotA [Nitrospirae bacterium RIFCSPLOWO2_02_42_7]OGW61236.1 MAG: flagellar motor protein MotA [Nitrospirae bacterium RIFCSPLOW2_12_42_9]
MDIFLPLGIIVSIGAILVGQALEGGHVGSITQFTAFLIVIGGTIGAVMVNYPLNTFMNAFKLAIGAVFSSKIDYESVITQLENYAQVARKEGILSLESKLKDVKDHFLRRGLQYVVDGTEPETLEKILGIEMAYEEERETLSAKVFETAGGFAPTVGILGAVLGLIHVMENLADPSKLGGGIATAFVATVYGVGSANLLFLPLAGNIKIKIRARGVLKELMIEGLMAIATGENPRLLREKLEGFLEKSKNKETKEAAG